MALRLGRRIERKLRALREATLIFRRAGLVRRERSAVLVRRACARAALLRRIDRTLRRVELRALTHQIPLPAESRKLCLRRRELLPQRSDARLPACVCAALRRFSGGRALLRSGDTPGEALIRRLGTEQPRAQPRDLGRLLLRQALRFNGLQTWSKSKKEGGVECVGR